MAVRLNRLAGWPRKDAYLRSSSYPSIHFGCRLGRSLPTSYLRLIIKYKLQVVRPLMRTSELNRAYPAAALGVVSSSALSDYTS